MSDFLVAAFGFELFVKTFIPFLNEIDACFQAKYLFDCICTTGKIFNDSAAAISHTALVPGSALGHARAFVVSILVSIPTSCL